MLLCGRERVSRTRASVMLPRTGILRSSSVLCRSCHFAERIRALLMLPLIGTGTGSWASSASAGFVDGALQLGWPSFSASQRVPNRCGKCCQADIALLLSGFCELVGRRVVWECVPPRAGAPVSRSLSPHEHTKRDEFVAFITLTLVQATSTPTDTTAPAPPCPAVHAAANTVSPAAPQGIKSHG